MEYRHEIPKDEGFADLEAVEAAEISASDVLPTRRTLHRKKEKIFFPLRVFAPIIYLIEDNIYILRKRLRSMHAASKAALLGYIPMKLFIGMSLITIGLYPYIWFWSNVYAFIKISDEKTDDRLLKRFAIIGLCVQLLFPLSIALYVRACFSGLTVDYEMAARSFVLYIILYVFVVFPQRCSLYFDLRWNMRTAVANWDRDGMMIGRAMTSWLKLFLLGSLYIQFQVNRLMGLGMPGFSDVDEMGDDRSLGEWVKEYVKKPHESGRQGRHNG